MSTHTAIAAVAKGIFQAIQVPTENPGEGEILLKNEYAGMIPFDTYVTDRGFTVQEYPLTLGFSASGTVAKVGPGVQDLKEGDRVTAFAFGPSSRKGVQEYSIQPRSVVAKVPDNVGLAEAATIPDNFVTAFYTIFNQLGLPIPSSFPATTPPPLAQTPILVYGAGSIAGVFTVQLLGLAGYKHVIAVASKRHHDYLRGLGAASTFDYNSTSLVEDIAKDVGGDGKVLLAVEPIAAESTLDIVAKVMSPSGTLAVLLPIKQGNTVTGAEHEEMYWEVDREKHKFPKETKIVHVRTFLYGQDERLKRELMPKILPQLLQDGVLQPSRVRLMKDGSLEERVSIGLGLLRENKISGEKVIVKIN